MEGFSSTVFKLTLGWVRNAVHLIWDGISNPSGGFFMWISDHWLIVFIILCVTGALLDLIVYLFRWRPDLVWKSYFRRRKGRKYSDQRIEGEENGNREPVHSGPRFVSNRNISAEGLEPKVVHGYTEEDDLERWREPEAEEYEEISAEEAMCTYYGVPLDSPYRRPVSDRTYDDDHRSNTERNLEKIAPQRRRRRSVAGLFSGEDDQMSLYEAPQPVIDSREAYHAPVFPRNWKENGEDLQ